MAGMFVPQMVAPVNTGGLADLGRSIGRYREDADIARVMKGLDPTDPNSIARTTTDLYQIPGGRDMADRLLGVWNTREQVTANRKELEAQRIRGQRAYQETLRSPAMTGAIPDDDTPGPTPLAPAGRPQAGTVTPAAQRAGSAGQPVMPTNKVWGDKEAEDAGLYEKAGTPTEPTAAATPAASVRFAGGPLQQLPPPPPRNPAATGATPVPVPPAPVPVARPAGPVPAPQAPAAALPPAAAPASAAAAPGLASIPPTAPRYETVVGTPPAEIGREAPRSSDTQIQQMITRLNAMRLNPDLDPKHKEAVAGRVHQLEKELERRGKQDDEVYKARVKFQEGYKTKTTEHGLKRGDEIGKQLQTDYGQAAVLREQSRILDDGLRTGALSDWGKWTDRAIDFVGSMIDHLPDKLVDKKKEFEWVKSARDTAAAMERFHGLGAKSLHDLLGGFGGGISNVEGNRLSAITAGTEKTVRGNAQLIKFTGDLIEARINAGVEAQRYMRDRKSKNQLIDAGDIDSIYAAHAKHAIDKMAAEHKANPLPPGPKPGEGEKAASNAPAARGGPATPPAAAIQALRDNPQRRGE